MISLGQLVWTQLWQVTAVAAGVGLWSSRSGAGIGPTLPTRSGSLCSSNA